MVIDKVVERCDSVDSALVHRYSYINSSTVAQCSVVIGQGGSYNMDQNIHTWTM